MIVLILSCLIFMVGGVVQGLTGFGAGLIAVPLLCLIMDVKLAVPLCQLNGVVITMYLAIRLRGYMDRKKILPLLIGSLPGIFIGASLLKVVDPQWIRMLLGILLISFSCYALLGKSQQINLSHVWGYFAGFCTGVITALLSAGGPPAIIYTTLTSWTKEEIKATLTGFFVISGIVTVLTHVMIGTMTGQTVRFFLVTMVFVLLGTGLGSRFSKRINRVVYLRLVYSFLGLMGLLMIFG